MENWLGECVAFCRSVPNGFRLDSVSLDCMGEERVPSSGKIAHVHILAVLQSA